MELPTEEKAPSRAPIPLIEEKKIIYTAALIVGADQATKQIVTHTIEHTSEGIVVIKGFLVFVNWYNTGAAWSILQDSSIALAILSLVAMCALIRFRNHFEIETNVGKIGMGLLIGGIIGNMIDRIAYQHVIDFIRFYIDRRGGGSLGYPAFNIADIGICVGVGILFVMAWRSQKELERSEKNEKKEQ